VRRRSCWRDAAARTAEVTTCGSLPPRAPGAWWLPLPAKTPRRARAVWPCASSCVGRAGIASAFSPAMPCPVSPPACSASSRPSRVMPMASGSRPSPGDCRSLGARSAIGSGACTRGSSTSAGGSAGVRCRPQMTLCRWPSLSASRPSWRWRSASTAQASPRSTRILYGLRRRRSRSLPKRSSPSSPTSEAHEKPPSWE
jgi:hypothetical protein